MNIKKISDTQLLETPPDIIIEKADLIRDALLYERRKAAIQKVLDEIAAKRKLFE